MIGNLPLPEDSVKPVASHHSLVTPIDWKLDAGGFGAVGGVVGHHSLVTPIDWKRAEEFF